MRTIVLLLMEIDCKNKTESSFLTMEIDQGQTFKISKAVVMEMSNFFFFFLHLTQQFNNRKKQREKDSEMWLKSSRKTFHHKAQLINRHFP